MKQKVQILSKRLFAIFLIMYCKFLTEQLGVKNVWGGFSQFRKHPHIPNGKLIPLGHPPKVHTSSCGGCVDFSETIH